MISKKTFLIFAAVSVSIIAMLYGISPNWFFTNLLQDEAPSIDQSHILRAVMTLYLSLGLFWLYCAYTKKYQDIGIVIITIFCGGLVSGRIISVIVDGIPSPILVLYIVMELGLVPISIWVLKRAN